MRLIFIVLLLTSFSVFAKEAKTNLFAIELPDEFQIETDKTSRLLAFSGKGPYDLPFLSIEFGKEIDHEELVNNVNNSLMEFGASLKEETCISNCKAFYVELTTKIKGEEVYRYHYIAKSERFTFIISYGQTKGLEVGRQFVKNIASQVLNNGI